MDAEQLAELKRRAAAATPGPWYALENDLIGGWCVGTLDMPPSQWPRGNAGVADFIDEGHARYIAAANPTALLSLMAHAERQQAAIVEAQRWLVEGMDDGTPLAGIAAALRVLARVTEVT